MWYFGFLFLFNYYYLTYKVFNEKITFLFSTVSLRNVPYQSTKHHEGRIKTPTLLNRLINYLPDSNSKICTNYKSL